MDLTKIVLNDAIVATIKKGVEHSATARGCIREAALEYINGLPFEYTTDDIGDIVKHGRELYRDIFNGDNNLFTYFGEVITLKMAGDMPVSFVDSKNKEQQMTAVEAIDLTKHDLQKAAKAVRDDLGIGRESGGGRKPQTPTSAPVQHVFSMVEFKSQLAGLFGHSKNPVEVLNTILAEYHTAAVSSADLEAFNKWKASNTKKPTSGRGRRAA